MCLSSRLNRCSASSATQWLLICEVASKCFCYLNYMHSMLGSTCSILLITCALHTSCCLLLWSILCPTLWSTGRFKPNTRIGGILSLAGLCEWVSDERWNDPWTGLGLARLVGGSVPGPDVHWFLARVASHCLVSVAATWILTVQRLLLLLQGEWMSSASSWHPSHLRLKLPWHP